MVHFIIRICVPFVFYFFFNDTATTEIYTLSLHDALPISSAVTSKKFQSLGMGRVWKSLTGASNSNSGPEERTVEAMTRPLRSEEHTSELQSQFHLVCRILLEKKKKK